MSKKGHKFRQYTKAFKENAVQMYIDGGFSFRALARELGIPSTPLKEWVKKYKDGETLSDGRGRTGRSRKRFESVEEERDYLKAQVDFLKKRFQNLYGEGSSQK